MKRKRKAAFIIMGVFLMAFIYDGAAHAVDEEMSPYIIADSDSRYLAEDEVKWLPLQVLNYAKNEIYARHGRKFHSEELMQYFNEQSWYLGTIEPEEFEESSLNDYERANAQLLSSLEHQASENGYQLDQPGYSFDVVYDCRGNVSSQADADPLMEFLRDEGGDYWEIEGEATGYAKYDIDGDGSNELLLYTSDEQGIQRCYLWYQNDDTPAVFEGLHGSENEEPLLFYSADYGELVLWEKAGKDEYYCFYRLYEEETALDFCLYRTENEDSLKTLYFTSESLEYPQTLVRYYEAENAKKQIAAKIWKSYTDGLEQIELWDLPEF